MIKISKIINYFEEEYPKSLLKIKAYPKKLYCLGDTTLLKHKKIVGIVGSRQCTDYGRKYAQIFATELAKQDVCIISGLAIGIDTVAHLSSLYEKGKTIAVLAGGLNHVYPKENYNLYNQIIKNGGCIISEHDDDTETDMHYFTKRNRIISGIADAIVVAECKLKSGSTSTATYAFSQEKTVYCIPRSMDSSFGLGINELISRGAKVVTSPQQIINELYSEEQQILDFRNIKSSYEAYYKMNEDKKITLPINDITKMKSKINIENIPKEYRDIYQILIKRDSTSDEISRILNLDIAEVNYKLTLMEIERYVILKGTNTFSINL